jgi:hypothetical protein
MLLPFAIQRFIELIVQAFIIDDAIYDEPLFDHIRHNQAIGIMSVRAHERQIHKEFTLNIIVDPSIHNWGNELSRNSKDFI